MSEPPCNGAGPSGFTIIEAVIALGILAVGLMTMAMLQVTALSVHSAALQMDEATRAGHNLVERLLALPQDHPDLSTGDGERQLDTPSPGTRITWHITETTGTKTIGVEIRWQANGRDRRGTLRALKYR